MSRATSVMDVYRELLDREPTPNLIQSVVADVLCGDCPLDVIMALSRDALAGSRLALNAASVVNRVRELGFIQSIQ
jgi:hypothetical protein